MCLPDSSFLVLGGISCQIRRDPARIPYYDCKRGSASPVPGLRRIPGRIQGFPWLSPRSHLGLFIVRKVRIFFQGLIGGRVKVIISKRDSTRFKKIQKFDGIICVYFGTN